MQVGHEENVAADVEVGGEANALVDPEGLAVGLEVLEPGVGPIGDDDGGVVAGAVVEPDAVRGLELAGLATGATLCR